MVCMQLKSGTPKISCFSNPKSSNNHILKRGLIAKLNRKSMLIPRMISVMRAFLDRQNFLPQHGTAGALERCGAQLLACKILFTSQHQLNKQAIWILHFAVAGGWRISTQITRPQLYFPKVLINNKNDTSITKNSLVLVINRYILFLAHFTPFAIMPPEILCYFDTLQVA